MCVHSDEGAVRLTDGVLMGTEEEDKSGIEYLDSCFWSFSVDNNKNILHCQTYF